MEKPRDTGKQKVRSAEVGTDILKALAELSPATSLSRLAEHVQMPASKVHRYLQALIASGFAEQGVAHGAWSSSSRSGKASRPRSSAGGRSSGAESAAGSAAMLPCVPHAPGRRTR